MLNRASLLLALVLLTATASAADGADSKAVGQWRAGTNYTVLKAAQPTSAAAGQIEVVEIFWYGCSHCYALDPALESWRETKAKDIDFRRTPVIWGPPHRHHAKLFYTLQALGRSDLHSKVFDAIHRDGNLLATNDDDVAARAMHLAFLRDHGVTEKDFTAAYDSAAVAANLQHAEEATIRFAVSSVPVVIVNGKYSTSVSMAGGTAPGLLKLIDDLAASERAR